MWLLFDRWRKKTRGNLNGVPIKCRKLCTGTGEGLLTFVRKPKAERSPTCTISKVKKLLTVILLRPSQFVLLLSIIYVYKMPYIIKF